VKLFYLMGLSLLFFYVEQAYSVQDSTKVIVPAVSGTPFSQIVSMTSSSHKLDWAVSGPCSQSGERFSTFSSFLRFSNHREVDAYIPTSSGSSSIRIPYDGKYKIEVKATVCQNQYDPFWVGVYLYKNPIADDHSVNPHSLSVALLDNFSIELGAHKQGWSFSNQKKGEYTLKAGDIVWIALVSEGVNSTGETNDAVFGQASIHIQRVF